MKKSPNAPPRQRGLYRFEYEHDACGVGLVADLSGAAGHETVRNGLTVLKNLMHRGATGNDPETGDGAGIMVQIPDAFFRRVFAASLPAPGRYAVGMLFGAGGEEALARAAARYGIAVLGWREVPVVPEAAGSAAQAVLPPIRQCFLDDGGCADADAFERKLFVIRRIVEKSCPDLYVCSLSCRRIVYKGLLLAPQMEHFYPDLNAEDFQSALAVVHQRYSTNTFPTWPLAHPFRYLAHNGEINTLRGNLNQLRSREASLASALFTPEEMRDILPLIPPDQSDSAGLDNMFELLTLAGRDPCHAMLMLIPQAWGEKYHMGHDVRAFFEYHAAIMEPWDGPAAVVFSDGVNAGAILDRNGLRPARYTLTRSGVLVLASETGVLDIPAADVVRKGRLKPGEILYCDLEHHRLAGDAEVKNTAARRRPYRRWIDANRIGVNGLFSGITPTPAPDDLMRQQARYGYTREDLDVILRPMAEHGKEPVGSMGNDAALAVLSQRPQSLFSYFKQLFAQVTNPPIDPIREELVMSLTTYIGNPGNILTESPEHARVIRLAHPVLTDDELAHLKQLRQPGFQCAELKLGIAGTLEEALQLLGARAVREVNRGNRILILSDRDLAGDEAAIPSLLAVACVNRALATAGSRNEAGLVVESAEVREVHHFALLLGFGATAVNPYLALASISGMVASDAVKADAVTAGANYIHAVEQGILKVMSKMGISTLRSYRGAQLFEAVGLDASVIDRYFPGTASRIGGMTLEQLETELRHRTREAQTVETLLPTGGQYRFRKDGEAHLWTPESLAAFRQAVQHNDPARYRDYAGLINDQSRQLCTLRGLFEFAPATPIPLEEVESVESILRRFVSGAMSLGSLSPEAHETIAIAMNRIGGMSNCGEGGEDPARRHASAIRQVASGRFGVTIDYLRHAKELQIKMAQGAKPGEGGQLPGHKVNDFIARIRHSMPHVTLISPPPHHDIYSIEDLAQLIYDLRNANPAARISVKLVSEVGVGTIAAGVAKAHADVVLISGHDGGTGASPLTSIKHAGLPWELGLAEAQQTLVLNRLRGHVRLQVDGQLKTGRDVVIGALLGAEEFGFATTILVCLGCVMMRQCHDNTCPVGVATQDPELRKRFSGKPEYIENFLRFLAMEVREYLAQLGLRSLDEAVGRSDLLRMNRAIDFYKAHHLDFGGIFESVAGGATRYDGSGRRELDNYDRRELLPELQGALADGSPVTLERTLRNVDRTVGTELAGEVAARHGAGGLPEGTIQVHFQGVAGQSFGAFLAPGITFDLEGEANDFVGKGLSGGRIVIRPPRDAAFEAAENVIAGNVIGYGGTSGKIFLQGQAGERFAIRNSGMTLVVEGIGDHGCEYMTAGRVVVLGPTGVNFAAGMTGGLAYVYDPANEFDLRCNLDSVDLENIPAGSEAEAELAALLCEHIAATGSPKAHSVLADWENQRANWVRVFPAEYRQALEKLHRHKEQNHE